MIGIFCTATPAIAQATLGDTPIQTALQRTLEWIDQLGAIGPLVLIAVYVFATVAFISGGLLTLGAGALFGLGLGSVCAFVGASLGATAAFLVGRYLVRDWVVQKLDAYPKFQAIDRAVGHEGLKIVLLTRLSPVFPFVLLNYAFGVTSVSLRDYAVGFLGMIPGTLLYTYLGSAVGNLATLFAQGDRTKSPAEYALFTIGLIATFVATWLITRIARRALDQEVERTTVLPAPNDP